MDTCELVSVVITTYGRTFEKIQRSINSVLKQSYKNIEIVLIDDNDNNSFFRNDIKNKINSYKNIIYIQNEKNMGAQISRNLGILNSRGKYIAFLDDDDEWISTKISKQLEIFNNKKNVGLVYCKGYTVIEENNEKKDYVTSKNFFKEVTFKELLYGDRIGTTSQALINKNVFGIVGMFDPDQPARQDYEMWLRISKKFRCIGIDEPLFKHYIHSGEQISKNNVKAIKGLENIYFKYKKDYDKNLISKTHIFLLIANRYKNQKLYLKSAKYFIKVLYFGTLSIIFDFNQFIKTIKEHNNAR